ncbi:MAG: glycosyltransferase family 4 protein [Patescibacteria group bacterium]|nr:glycosyltransferase family 4 protein [Patescibacteria group bacterium]
MKIIIATGIFIPELGGPATYAPNIAQEFIKLGHRVSVLTYSDKDKYDFDKGLTYPLFRIKRSNKILNYFRYYKALVKTAKDADIIYAFDYLSAGLPAVLFCRFYKKTLFIRTGGDFLWEKYLDESQEMLTLREFYEKGIYKKQKIRLKIIKWVLRRAQGIIFTTNFQKEIFAKFYQLDSKRLFVVPNPPSIINAIVKKEEPNKEIIFAGRFINKNNIINLIAAFTNIKDKDYQLVLIGEGPLQEKIEEIISRLAIKNIRLEGKLSRLDLRQRLASAYLVVFPSLTDISPNTMLECLDSQIPFISSQEIGFDWLVDKIITFDPKNIREMSEKIEYLLDKNNYDDYQKTISSLNYDYDYQKAGLDTIKIFSQL